ncbi:MAG: hypothetical protein FJ404_05415 [Verrucomicrobia bacterium]|nr:hypothetical protein [Verrucomicrobiota bacterium]
MKPPRSQTSALGPLLRQEACALLDRIRYGILGVLVCAALGHTVHREFLDTALSPEPISPTQAIQSKPPRRRPVIPAELQFPVALQEVRPQEIGRQPSCLSEPSMVVRPGAMARVRTA